MASDEKNICFRPTAEMRQYVAGMAEHFGVTMSEYVRSLLQREMNQPALMGPDEGYKAGRKLALRAMHQMIMSAGEMLPETYEEAVARFGLAGPGIEVPDLVQLPRACGQCPACLNGQPCFDPPS